MRTLYDGLQGSAMPSFKLVPEVDRRALVEYVKYLSMRGEMELAMVQYVAEADKPDLNDPKNLMPMLRHDRRTLAEPNPDRRRRPARRHEIRQNLRPHRTPQGRAGVDRHWPRDVHPRNPRKVRLVVRRRFEKSAEKDHRVHRRRVHQMPRPHGAWRRANQRFRRLDEASLEQGGLEPADRSNPLSSHAAGRPAEAQHHPAQFAAGRLPRRPPAAGHLLSRSTKESKACRCPPPNC